MFTGARDSAGLGSAAGVAALAAKVRLLPPPPRIYHALSWRGDDLPYNAGRCLACGEVVTAERWLTEDCPKRSER